MPTYLVLPVIFVLPCPLSAQELGDAPAPVDTPLVDTHFRSVPGAEAFNGIGELRT